MQKKHHGYILLLMLLIVVVIGCIISLSSSSTSILVFNKVVPKDASGQILPWGEKKRFVPGDKEVQPPSTVQPQLMTVLGYKSYPAEGGQDRGEIMLMIDTDGRVRGNWSGDYREGQNVSFAVLSGAFKGNIDPTNLYRDKSGTDPSKLYFIARGSFMLLEDNKKNPGSRQRQGEIYVTGWIDFDYKLIGKIVLTSDEKTYRLFTWSCSQPTKGKDFFGRSGHSHVLKKYAIVSSSL